MVMHTSNAPGGSVLGHGRRAAGGSMALLAGLVLSACASSASGPVGAAPSGPAAPPASETPTTDPGPELPVAAAASPSLMAALLEGSLAVIADCLVIDDGTDEVTIGVWPPGWSATVRGDRIVVLDAGGEVFARDGDAVKVGGGHSDDAAAALPESCSDLEAESEAGVFLVQSVDRGATRGG